MATPANQSSVCIIGVGAQTALGRDAPSTMSAVRCAISAFENHPNMIDKAGEPMLVAQASYVSDDTTGSARFAALAIPAAQEALGVLEELPGAKPDIPVVIGLPTERVGLPKGLSTDVAAQVTEALSGAFQTSDAKTLESGHSAGMMALERGWQNIQSGRFECCLVGGVDSYHEPETLEWLDDEEQLLSDANKWGFIPGEAAGFVLLATPDFAKKHDLPILGELALVATTRESNLIKTDSVCLGEGLSLVCKHVLGTWATNSQKIHQTICDMNGERYRATEYGFMTTRTGQFFDEPGDFQAPADCWGDVGAASGPLFVGLAVVAGSKGYARGPNTLLWTSSETGERSAAVLQVELSAGSD